MSGSSYFSAPSYLVSLTIDPAFMLVLGWCLLRGIGLLFGAKPLTKTWGKYVRHGLLISLAVAFLILSPFLIWLVSVSLHATSGSAFDLRFAYVPVYQELLDVVLKMTVRYPGVYGALGRMLWIFGFPRKKKEDQQISTEGGDISAHSEKYRQ